MKNYCHSISQYKIILQIILYRTNGGKIVEIVFTFHKTLKSLK